MDIIRKSLFESETLNIGLFAARPVSDACGDVEQRSANVVVLPVSGVFAKHDAPGHHVIGTPSHAVFVAADTPFRISFPGAVGDRALTLRYDQTLAPEMNGRRNGTHALSSNGLIPARAMMLRNLIWAKLQKEDADRFEIEALGLDLLNMSFASMRMDASPFERAAQVRRRRALERVKEAVAVAPSRKWNIAKLAGIANLSPFHLCRVFRDTVGTSIYDYVLLERLASTLDAVLDGEDLTTVALDAGFASHSHFTSRFKKFFGCTPASLRQMARTERSAELRKIMTARLH